MFEGCFHRFRTRFARPPPRAIIVDRHAVSSGFQRRGDEPESGSVATLPEAPSSDALSIGREPFLATDATEIDDSGSGFSETPLTASALDAFAVQIHQSLKPQDVVTVAVHELRQILRCERVCFLERRGNRFRLVAASGQSGIPPRSRLASLLEQFVVAVLPQGERFLFPNDSVVLPDDWSRRLADYWEVANGQLILVEPVFATLPDPHRSTAQIVVGALVIEQFSRSSLAAGAISRVESAVRHLTPALANARKYSRLAVIPGLFPLGLILEWIRRTSTFAIMALMIVAGLMAGAFRVERPFEIECHGRLMPTLRREVFAGVEGEIVSVEVHESEHVEEGQIIARLQSREQEKALIEQAGSLKGKLKARDAARAELRTRSTPQVRGQSARDQAQLEIISAEIDTIHRQLELLEQEQQQLVIRAPIAGTITTQRPREKLLGRPVRRGDAILEIMDESGGWQIELAVAERKIGYLLSYRHHQSTVNVKFRLLSSAQKTFDGTVTRLADRTVPSADLGSCSLVFCDVPQTNQIARQVGSEVSARIQCGEKKLAFLWFHEFRELLQRNWWL